MFLFSINVVFKVYSVCVVYINASMGYSISTTGHQVRLYTSNINQS